MRSSLGEHEQTYVTEVRRQLRDVPAMRRRELLDQATDHLAERPAAETFDQLLDAVGSPKSYSSEMRANAQISTRFRKWQRFIGQRRGVLTAQIFTAGTLAIGSLVAWSWFTAVPDISNSCSGARAGQVETLHAAGETEYRMTYQDQGRVGVFLCLFSSDTDLVITGVRPHANGVSMLQPVGAEAQPALAFTGFTGDAGSLQPFRPNEGAGTKVRVWFEWEYCGFWEPGGGMSFDSMLVDYDYRWRHRTARLDLNATY